jgi:RND family efflux transporter MFP subunit
MKSINYIISIGLVLIVSFILISCGNTNADSGKNNSGNSIRPINVKIEVVKLTPFSEAIQTTGIAKSYEDVMLSSEEGGIVKEWKVSKGSTVTIGQILVQLDDAVMRASYEAAKAQYEMAQLNYEKQEQVYKEKGISELQLKSLMYGRDAAKAQADLMKSRLDKKKLHSPINGVLDDQFYDIGELAPPGMPVARLINLSQMKISAEVTEREVANIKIGMAVEMTFDALDGFTAKGKISFVGSAVNPSNRTLPVEIKVQNPAHIIKPEMIAKVRILQENRTNAVVVKENVIQQVDRNKTIVFIENNGKAEEREVRTGGHQNGKVKILQGLKPGDRLIISGFELLTNNYPVNVAN